LEELFRKAASLKANSLLVVNRWKGSPGKIELYTLFPRPERRFPIIYLASVKTQHEFGDLTRVNKIAAMVDEESKPEVKRLAVALSSFIDISLFNSEFDYEEYEACLSFCDTEIYEARLTFIKLPEKREMGPSLIVRHTVWTVKHG
jgi:rRNA maturation protein Rpf1